ncbi:MAG: hypothetical protein V3W14_00230, partial [Candidatus Neomarinimicrobiota bacterium]
KNLLWIRYMNPRFSLEITKRYSRCMSSRNVVTASILLALAYFTLQHFVDGMVFIIISALSCWDFTFRQKWLLKNIDVAVLILQNEYSPSAQNEAPGAATNS